MISKTYIQENLRQLDVAYRNATVQKHSVYFSKLAILELCGWIEMSMDDLMLRHASRVIKQSANQSIVDEFVKRNYGFEYDRHFRQMLMKLVGIVTCEQIEAAMNVQVHTKFTTQLTSLKRVRDGLAHTYSKAHTATIDAPSVTKARFVELYDGLKAYETALRAL